MMRLATSDVDDMACMHAHPLACVFTLAHAHTPQSCLIHLHSYPPTPTLTHVHPCACPYMTMMTLIHLHSHPCIPTLTHGKPTSHHMCPHAATTTSMHVMTTITLSLHACMYTQGSPRVSQGSTSLAIPMHTWTTSSNFCSKQIAIYIYLTTYT